MSSNSNNNRKKEALDYHSMGRPGKIAVVPTKPHSSQRDLTLAYSPGVAEPCLAIAENSEDAYKYTAKGNLVAVISNGTAVLGLGDIGAQAGKPVMEGKGLLFKIFADIDVFDIELDTKNVDEFVNIVKALEPTFGGINLEDIKAPECFEIERRLKEEMNIPVMHDDQHGTAIISGAALINACELTGKDLSTTKIVVNGAVATRKDIIMGTGRSDYPNQVNNVLGFPYIFRGALDVRATRINEEMKIAAVRAIAALAKQYVPEEVNQAYGTNNLKFGTDYIIPKPTDPRLITEVSIAVAKAAIESGVARQVITDWEQYKEDLRKRSGKDDGIMRMLTRKAKQDPKKVVFAEADNYKTLRAAQIVKEEKIAFPILLGNRQKIEGLIKEYDFELGDVEIIDPLTEADTARFNKYADHLYAKRQRRGISANDAKKLMLNRNYFAASMVQFGEADTLISGLTKNYGSTIRPALQVIGAKPNSRVAGMYMMLTEKGPIFFGDTTVNEDPNAEELADISLLLNNAIKRFNIKPRIALLSYSNFGSNDGKVATKMRETAKILREKAPEVIVDGDIQANFALNSQMLKSNFPFSALNGEPANTLVFPNLESGNIAYKLLQEVGNAEAVGPILLGMNKPVHVLQLDSSVREIVNMVTIAVVDVQEHEKQK